MLVALALYFGFYIREISPWWLRQINILINAINYKSGEKRDFYKYCLITYLEVQGHRVVMIADWDAHLVLAFSFSFSFFLCYMWDFMQYVPIIFKSWMADMWCGVPRTFKFCQSFRWHYMKEWLIILYACHSWLRDNLMNSR